MRVELLLKSSNKTETEIVAGGGEQISRFWKVLVYFIILYFIILYLNLFFVKPKHLGFIDIKNIFFKAAVNCNKWSFFSYINV